MQYALNIHWNTVDFDQGLGQGRTSVQLLITAVIWLKKGNTDVNHTQILMQIIHKYAKNKYFLKDSVCSPVIKCAKCCIVLKCDLWHFVLWVYGHLECVGA